MQYGTPRLRNPSTVDRIAVNTTNYIWKYGDRYYNLAQQFYGVPEYWWVIAWWNARPSEADILPGDVITIPLDLETTLNVLGAF